MTDLINCLFEDEKVDFVKAAKHYNDQHCFDCSSHDTCKSICRQAREKKLKGDRKHD